MSSDNDHHHAHGTPDDIVVRVRALETLLVEKGLVDPTAMDDLIDQYEHKIGPHIGAKVVAKAWVDPKYKQLLLTDANAALAEFSATRLQGEDMVVVENTPQVHNVIVCTLCSCYPYGVLGLPPNWYKSPAYRSQVVRDPRQVLRQFGFDLPASKEVRVWDSTAELRYMVLPCRPQGTGHLSEGELAKLVTRDAMIGVTDVSAPHSGQ